MKKSKDINIFKISDSPLFRENNKININRTRFDDSNEYNKVLDNAKEKGFAIIINGNEPTDQELLRIKELYDRFGEVKVFRKRYRNKFFSNLSIKPSSFREIKGKKFKDDEIDSLKQSVCHYIVELIKS